MKKILITIFVSSISVSCFISCEKETDNKVSQSTDLDNKAFIKVYNGTVNSKINDLVIGDKRLTGSLLSLGSAFPGSLSYAAVEAGNTSLTFKDTTRNTVQPVITITQNFEKEKYYTIFAYDTLNAMKYKLVQDNIIIPTDTTARVRFANFPYSKTTIPNIDIFSKRLNQNVFTNVTVQQITDFIPFPTRQTDTLFVRETGKTANIATLNTFVPEVKRSYTLVFKGSYVITGAVSSTNPFARDLVFYTNR